MQVQIPFFKIPLFSPGGEEPKEQDSLVYHGSYPTWGEFSVLCVILAIAQREGRSFFSLPKKEIMGVWGKTCQGKNYSILEKSLNKWLGAKIKCDDFEGEILSYHDYEKGKRNIKVVLGEDFFQYSVEHGQIWDLEKFLSMNSVVFRLVQIMSCLLHYRDTIRFCPLALASMVSISAEKKHIAKKKIRSKMGDVMIELRRLGLACSESWEKPKGQKRTWLYVSKECLYTKAFEGGNNPPPPPDKKRKPVQLGQLTPANIQNRAADFKNCINSEGKEQNNSSLSTQNSTTEYEKSQGEFDKACSFYERISSNFKRRNLDRMKLSVLENWRWHEKAINFSCKDEVETKTFPAAAITAWYKDGCVKDEKRFRKYREAEKEEERRKLKEKASCPILKQAMFDDMIDLIRNLSEKGKRDIAEMIEYDPMIQHDFDARNRFRNIIVDKAYSKDIAKENAKSRRFREKYISYGEDLLDCLYSLDEFGKVMEKSLPKNWWPKFELGKKKPEPEKTPEDESKKNERKRLLTEIVLKYGNGRESNEPVRVAQ